MNTTTSTGRFPFGVDTDALPCDVCGVIACDVDHGPRASECRHENVRQLDEHDVQCLDCGQVSA